ncbi:unnamed protein product [Closterium sp. NIES-64]|nr:unnamed protein product [Closterium sp. NIES-64]
MPGKKVSWSFVGKAFVWFVSGFYHLRASILETEAPQDAPVMDRARMAPLLLLLLLPFAAAAPTAAPTGKSPPAAAKAPAPAPPVTPPKTLPACPLTGKPATKPTIPHSRCVEAQQLSCCADCADLTFPIQVLAIDVAAALEPGHEECEQLIEQLVCAVTCNPDSGYYFIDTPTGPYMQVCKAFAQQVYDKCSTLKVGDISVDMVIYNPEQLIKQAIVPLVAEAVPGFTAGVSDVGCYGGPQVLPATPLCCDPLAIPKTCPAGSVNTTGAEKIPGRKPDAKICAKYPYKTGTIPYKRPALPPTAFDKPTLPKPPLAPSSAPAPAPGSDSSPGPAMAPSSGSTVDGGSSPPTAPPPAPSTPSPPTAPPPAPSTPSPPFYPVLPIYPVFLYPVLPLFPVFLHPVLLYPVPSTSTP